MSTKELRPVCSVGMFDLLKGVAILFVIVLHSYSWIISAEDHPIFIFVSSIVSNTLVYGLIIAAGFGIRKRPVKKCALQLKKMFFAPYVLTGLASTLLFSINYFFLSSSFSTTLLEGLLLITGFVIGQHPNQYYGKFLIGDIGPVWFIIALAGGRFILNLILSYSQGWKRNLLVFLSSILGYFGNLHASIYGIPIPFCFFNTCDFVLLLYIGYLAKENKWLEKMLSPIAIILICASIAALVWKYKTSFLLSNGYPLGVFTPYALAIESYGVVYLMTHINRRENPITDILETIGNNSITILCVHTLEYNGILWSWFINCLPNASNTHMIYMILIYRLVFIALGMLVIKTFQKWGGLARLKEMLLRKKTA